MQPNAENHIGIANSLAWSFHKTTGIAFEVLFDDALESVCKAVHKFDPNKEIKEQTYIWKAVKNNLIEFIQQNKQIPTINIDQFEEQYLDVIYNTKITPESIYGFKEIIRGMSKDAQFICRLILSSPAQFAAVPPKEARGLIRILLRDILNWKFQRIDATISEIKYKLNNA